VNLFLAACDIEYHHSFPTMTNVKKLLSSAQYRPYTAYNIFFQLEREFILQSILDVTPSVDNAFDQVVDDVIPLLPQKYREVVLSDDWYIPGKAQRKKRKHRKSHGKISFSDLSKNVAAAWHDADDEVKLFCAQVSDYLMQEYKKAIYRQRKDGINTKEEDDTLTESKGTKSTRKKILRPGKVVSSTADIDEIISSTTSAVINAIPCTQPIMRRVTSENTSTVVSDSSVEAPWPSVGQLSLPLPSYHAHYYSVSQVDIDDEAIWNMWMDCDK